MYSWEFSYTSGEMIIGISTLENSLTITSKVKGAIASHLSGIMQCVSFCDWLI